MYAHPSRAIRTHDFLFIRNLAPREWRTGETGREPRTDDERALLRDLGAAVPSLRRGEGEAGP